MKLAVPLMSMILKDAAMTKSRRKISRATRIAATCQVGVVAGVVAGAVVDWADIVDDIGLSGSWLVWRPAWLPVMRRGRTDPAPADRIAPNFFGARRQR